MNEQYLNVVFVTSIIFRITASLLISRRTKHVLNEILKATRLDLSMLCTVDDEMERKKKERKTLLLVQL